MITMTELERIKAITKTMIYNTSDNETSFNIGKELINNIDKKLNEEYKGDKRCVR